jgi:hypothetical protein
MIIYNIKTNPQVFGVVVIARTVKQGGQEGVPYAQSDPKLLP